MTGFQARGTRRQVRAATRGGTERPTAVHRRSLPAALATVVLLVLGALLVSAADAGATAYRYWSFWELGEDGAWVYATQGPSLARPGDGDVVGLRFTVSAASGDTAAQPRGGHDFTVICRDTPARSGTKRVALVLDFGTPSDAPGGAQPPKSRTVCARTAPGATTAEALARVAAPLRYDSNALLCAVAGYPHAGCGEPVSSANKENGDGGSDPAGNGQDSAEHTPSAGIAAGACAVALLATAAVWRSRRRRS